MRKPYVINSDGEFKTLQDCVEQIALGIADDVENDILKMINHEFGCDLANIKKKHIADIHEFIDCYELPTIMKERYKL